MRSKQLQDSFAYAPRLMRADRAAAYLGMSQSFFLALVNDGVFPKSIRIRGIVVWDRWKLDSAVDSLADEASIEVNTTDLAMGINTQEPGTPEYAATERALKEGRTPEAERAVDEHAQRMLLKGQNDSWVRGPDCHLKQKPKRR